MFILTTIADVIQIEANDFRKPSAQALEDNINQRYANKVVLNVGLCICFYDLLSSSEGLIGHGEGNVHVNVEFRLIVFRPFRGEILEGTIVDAEPSGMRLSVEFFEDVTVPCPSAIFTPAHFEPNEGAWIWTNEDEPYYFDKGEKVRLRVEQEIWEDQAPEGPEIALQENKDSTIEAQRKKRSPYKLVASMQHAGVGPLTWWS